MALGVLKIPLTQRQYFVVTGGPFRECPDTMKGVKMAQEIVQKCAVDIPTRDFCVPDKQVLYKGLNAAVDLLLAGEPLYVGCMGGKGRTGLFLAVLAKAVGVESPVEFVRKHYYAHAVETPEQYAFVKAFLVTPTIRTKIRTVRRSAKYGFWGKRFWKRNLTRMPRKVKVSPKVPVYGPETAACYSDGRLKPAFQNEIQRAQKDFSRNVRSLFGKVD